MKVENIDKNLKIGGTINKDGMVYYSIPNDSFALYGVEYDKKLDRLMRMDSDCAASVSPNVQVLSQHVSGGRLRFATNSKRFELTAAYDELWILSQMAIEGTSGYMLIEENEDGTTGFFKMLPPTKEQNKGFTLSAELPGGKVRNYILWFPLYNQATRLTIGLEEGAVLEKGRQYKDIKPILYYGSSITQGGCASRPDNSYEALISKWNNVDFINLGFSGSAMAEDNMVDYLTKIDTSLFVCDYDHNAQTVEHLESTHYRLYERYRKVKKDVPILFLSSPNDSFGVNTNKRKQIIKNTYLKAKKNGDNNVYFIDGKNLVGKIDRMNAFVDTAHPNDLGFYRMAKTVYNKIIKINKDFK